MNNFWPYSLHNLHDSRTSTLSSHPGGFFRLKQNGERGKKREEERNAKTRDSGKYGL